MPIAVLYIDIDYFKLFNDYYGHDHGDDCLQHIAKILKDSAARSSDLCSRLGGEEFIIVLPETDLDHAVFVADKIHSNLASSKFHHKASEISEYVTVSIGISSTVPDHATGEDVLIHNADQALYNAKESGRNQTACWKNNTKSEQT